MTPVHYLQSGPQNYKFAQALQKAFSASGMRYHIAYTRDGIFFMVEEKDMVEARKVVAGTPYC
jgi:hypothetical protein